MSNNYLKISRIGQENLESNIKNGQLKLQGLGENYNLEDINQALRFITNPNLLSADSFFITLIENIDTLSFSSSINQIVGKLPKFYIEVNSKQPYYEDYSFNKEIKITNFLQKVNNLVISPVYDDDTVILNNNNLINEIIFNNQLFSVLVLNLPAMHTISITNNPNLTYFNTSNFDSLKSIIITDTNISQALKISKLASLANINLTNNQIPYIEIEGVQTSLSLANCKLYPQKFDILKYVKFKNCKVAQDLLNQLARANIEVEIE